MLRHEQLMKEEAARKNDLITYLAHEIITLHGGTITADSAQELTTFRVTLPR